MAESARTCPQVNQQARIFIAVAWASIHDIRVFKLFPEVFHVDCTCDGNVTGNYLLTFSCRTSTGKQVVFLKIWIPSQKRFSFRWVFAFVLCSLIPASVFFRTRLVMVDGDPQQRDELSKAIEEYIPNARIGGCGWHIVNQGWKRHGPNKTAVIEGTKRDKYQLFTKHVKDWIYSWMTPGGAESLEEYSFSKELLFAYVSSHEGLGACDGHHHIIAQITDFVRQYVIIYDNLFLFYKKKNIRYFNTKTSSAHEGTNYGIKEHAASVRPSQRLSVATRNLSLQSSMKASQMEAESTYAVSSTSLWGSSDDRYSIWGILVRMSTDTNYESGHAGGSVPYTGINAGRYIININKQNIEDGQAAD
jgi:hypothetical protein